jgi:signal transduction histidine kinase
VTLHPDILATQERFPDDFTGFLRNLVLFEPDSQLYLLGSDGTVLASSGDVQLPAGFKVALGPVMEAIGTPPMPYVMGDDPERMDASAVVAARPLMRAVIRNEPAVSGYLYLVCHKPNLPEGRWAVLKSTLARPSLVSILAVVALTTLLAAWVTAAVTRPLARLTALVSAVTQGGLDKTALQPQAMPDLPVRDSRDEFGQLGKGINAMLATLRTQWRTLRQLDHFRREGVSNLSHDLRSPLTATAACLETLENRWAGDDARAADRQLVEVARRNTLNAARLVQSLGDLAQLDEPAFELRSEVMDVAELLDDVALRFAERAGRQGVRMASGAASGIESVPLAAVDVELFERAIANLVDNALKFCPAGATITLGAVTIGNEVHVSVSDTGPGIPAADLPHLFDRFYQSRQSVAPATGEGGKGLGLAIVKRIVELHGGRVDVTSPAGAGTCVLLILPRARG